MNKTKLTILVFMVVMLLIVLLSPFKAFGDGIKPGLGDLINGLAGLAMIFAILAIAIVGRKRD